MDVEFIGAVAVVRLAGSEEKDMKRETKTYGPP